MMKGRARVTCRNERSSSEPSSQKAISRAANGLGARFMASAVPAPASAEIASPDRIRISSEALRPAMLRSRNTERKAPAMAASGRPQASASVTPSEMLATAKKAAVCGAPKSEGAARGLRRSPCIAAPERPRIAPMETASRSRGIRISSRIRRSAGSPAPRSAESAAVGPMRTGPTPRDRIASTARQAASVAIVRADKLPPVPARSRAAPSLTMSR